VAAARDLEIPPYYVDNTELGKEFQVKFGRAPFLPRGEKPPGE
jgi:hypothetical protein